MTIGELERPSVAGERIVKIASSFSFVRAGTPVHETLDGLREAKARMVAVVDPASRPLGIILAQDLVDILGKPYGRDLLKRQCVEDIMRDVAKIRYDEYISVVRERAGAELELGENAQYLLVDRDGLFRGCVSSRDILVHGTKQHQREIQVARGIQNRLVPEYSMKGNGTFTVVCSALMAEGVGGDYYFVREYVPGSWFLCLCDISGKGTAAAIITAVLAGFMDGARLGSPLSETVIRLNDLVLGTFRAERYLTGVFVKYDEATGDVEYCDMGHSLLYVVSAGGVRAVSEVAGNPPLGMVALQAVTADSLALGEGETLLAVSDGLTEQENRRGEPFRLQTVGDILGNCPLTRDGLVRAKVEILEAFYAFKRDMPQRDDVSFLMARRNHPGP